MDIQMYNRQAWDSQVKKENEWTQPVSPEVVERARSGQVEVVLTPKRLVPAEWFPPLKGSDVLCLASGGGQQGPLFAAAGAHVTVFDNSPEQLGQDLAVAEREGLQIATKVGDMRDLSIFADDSFDLIFHPCSISFVPDTEKIWEETYRVLRPGGTYLLGACNPVMYIFDYEKYKKGEFELRHSIPYSDLEQLTEDELQAIFDDDEPLCFGHKLESVIGGQTKAGFHITGFFEDYFGEDSNENFLDKFLPSLYATRAIKCL